MSQTSFFIIKVIISGILIAAISTLAKTFPKWAALLTALPMMTLLSLVWIYFETRDLALLENYTRDVLIWVLPSLLFFVAAIYFFRAKMPFVVTMALSIAFMGIGVWVFERLHLLK